MILIAACVIGMVILTLVERRVGSATQRGKTPGTRELIGRRASKDDGTTILIGHVGRRAIRSSVEDSHLIAGPPRSGKGTRLMIPFLLRWLGPAVVTSTRDDLLRACAVARAKRGPVWLFDPAALITNAELPVIRTGGDPVTGCEDPLTAILRARSIVAASRSSEGVTNGDFWRGSAEVVLRCYLHAAAIGGLDVSAVQSWIAMQTSAKPVGLLAEPTAAPGWGAELEAVTKMDARTRTNIFAGVSLTMTCLADPRVIHMCTTGASFDIDRFFAENGTLFLVGQSDAQLSVAPLIVALVESIVDAARRRAASSPTGRVDPALGLFLDEAAQIAPLPSLPRLVADGGGSGITSFVVLQSLAQARHRWGQHAAESIWDASTTKLILGGLGNDADLQTISRLCGDVERQVVSRSRDGSGGGGSTVSTRTQPRFTPADLRGLRPDRGLLLHRGATPTVVTLRPYWKQKDLR